MRALKKFPKEHGLKNYSLPDKYGVWLGYKPVRVSRKKGEAVLELKLRDDHLSPAGRIHGGVISGFFDFACGAAVFSTMEPEDFCSTVELKVNYFSPLNSGDTLVCRSQVVFRGRRLCVVHALLYRKGQKNPVAMATATFNIVAKKP
ncbi:MAG TPA: PaaI family thioesterase [bacterium]|nr:PaaI family thioesterase [bacterium]